MAGTMTRAEFEAMKAAAPDVTPTLDRSLNSGERQVGATLADIRPDHVARYRLACQLAAAAGWSSVWDVGCGTGYGSAMLAGGGLTVVGLDISRETIDYAVQTWVSAEHRLGFLCQDCQEAGGTWRAWRSDAVIALESLEHMPDPPAAVANWRGLGGALLVSMPNADVVPLHDPATGRRRFPFHTMHATPAELEAMLRAGGWTPERWWHQRNKADCSLRDGPDGWTMTVLAR